MKKEVHCSSCWQAISVWAEQCPRCGSRDCFRRVARATIELVLCILGVCVAAYLALTI